MRRYPTMYPKKRKRRNEKGRHRWCWGEQEKLMKLEAEYTTRINWKEVAHQLKLNEYIVNAVGSKI